MQVWLLGCMRAILVLLTFKTRVYTALPAAVAITPVQGCLTEAYYILGSSSATPANTDLGYTCVPPSTPPSPPLLLLLQLLLLLVRQPLR